MGSKFQQRVFCWCIFVMCLAVIPNNSRADVIVEGDPGGVFPFNIESNPNVVGNNIFVGRLRLFGGFPVAPINGELTVNALGSETSVSTNLGALVGVQERTNGTLNIIGNGAAGSASFTSNFMQIGGRSFLSTTSTGGAGQLNIEDGGRLETSQGVFVGSIFGVGFDSNGSNTLDGAVNVVGRNSSISTTSLNLGNLNAGTSGLLSVRNGGRVTIENESPFQGRTVSVGSLTTNGKATIEIDGDSSVIQTDNVTLRAGELNITNGGQLTLNRTNNGGVLVGVGSTAELLVTGQGSELSISGNSDVDDLRTGDLFIGGADIDDSVLPDLVFVPGNGIVTVEHGGRVFAGKDIYIGGNKSIGLEGEPNSAGTLIVRDSGRVQTSNIFVAQRGRLEGGDGFIQGNVMLNGGTILPGNSPGTMFIDGDLILNSGLLEIELDSPSLTDFIDVTGDVFFGDNLIIQLIFGFVPTDVIDLSNFFNFGSFEVDPGFDLLANLDLVFTPNAGVTDGDIVTISLLDSVQDFSISATTSVPEPGSLALLVFGLGGLAYAKRRRHPA